VTVNEWDGAWSTMYFPGTRIVVINLLVLFLSRHIDYNKNRRSLYIGCVFFGSALCISYFTSSCHVRPSPSSMSAAPPLNTGTIPVKIYIEAPNAKKQEKEQEQRAFAWARAQVEVEATYTFSGNAVIPRATTVKELYKSTAAIIPNWNGFGRCQIKLYAMPAGAVMGCVFSPQGLIPLMEDLEVRLVDDILLGGMGLVVTASKPPPAFDIGVYVGHKGEQDPGARGDAGIGVDGEHAEEEDEEALVDGPPAEEAPGESYLREPVIHEFSREAVAEIVGKVLHREGRVGSIDYVASYALDEIVNAEKRAALIAEVTTAYELGDSYPPPTHALTPLEEGVLAGSVRTDFKILLTVERARELLGDAVYNDVVFPLGKKHGPPDALVLRRTEATGRWIGFHTDNARRTVQVPLSDDSACEGGRLVFLHANGEMEFPKRVAGGLVMHDGDIVHGVTALRRGVRYSFYALRARKVEDV
jgi:hypothetical protein